ncbi:armadillo-type protein [Ephemerocybe angulata]|uniref:Armadillo-type protein n=1 Tax=Ephemerocybe angulata TaxID=980116 RepID=A0A8H6HK82_9AGAR|nr:armadillo-type protein [Tulosesus angulatus]
MADFSFLPTLTTSDVDRAAQLIQLGYGPSTSTTTPEDLKRLQQELFEMQRRPEAWGLVIPLLNHEDPNVQFFGAHTAQVKVARDWDAFPRENAEQLRDLLVQLTAHSIAIGRGNFILRKLFVAIASLAIKLVPGHPSRWPGWILSCVQAFSEQGGSAERIHQFLVIVAEEVGTADLLGASKVQMQQSLRDAIPLVVQAITSSVNRSVSISQFQSALLTLQAWMTIFPSSDLLPFIPILIGLLDPSDDNEAIFIAASDTLQEILSKSPLSDGAATKTLTEPLLVWLDSVGSSIIAQTIQNNDVNEVSHSLSKLLVALGDHSALYIAANISSSIPVIPGKTKGYLAQTFLRLIMAYTGLQGYYGADEEESALTLDFWYLFQEALWSTEYFEDPEDDVPPPNREDPVQVKMAKEVYIELVKVLRRKVAFPPPPTGWGKDQIDAFNVYRRDVGDTLINAFYVLRDDMLSYYVGELAQLLADEPNWQDVEATLHCIMSVQEAVDLEKAPQLARLFNQDILGRLPTTGHNRLRRTTLSVIGTYSTWFTLYAKASDTPADPTLLLNVLNYVVTALTDPALCLQAAIALRNLCDTNRKALAPHIGAFGQLHDGLERIPDSEKSKILQSIASVIEALPAQEMIPPVQAIVSPVVQKLVSALQTASTLPDEARTMVILQLEILAGISKGLTRSSEGPYGDADEDDPAVQAQIESIKVAREDPRMQQLRNDTFSSIRSIIDIWSTDAEISHALSDLFKSITSLPSDITLISQPAGPLLELICVAAQKQLTATWLSLAAILIAQLNPPSYSLVVKSAPVRGAEAILSHVLPVLLQCGLTALAVPGAMEANPDIVQEFFACMDRVAQDFTKSFYTLAPGLLDALMQCAISSLALQERYSLVAAANFMSNLIHRSSLTSELNAHKLALLASHGRSITRAILQGFAGVAPRSVVPNLIEMLGALMNRSSGTDGGPATVAHWMQDILFSNDFVQSKAGPETKKEFIKAVLASRSLKKTREAAQQFALVARGLEGSSFGYASVVAM